MKEVQEQHEENMLQAETLEGSTAFENTVGLVATPSFALGAEVLQLLLVGVQHATVRARLAELPVSQVERLVPSLQQVDLRVMEERVSIAVSVLRTQESIPRKEYFLFITLQFNQSSRLTVEVLSIKLFEPSAFRLVYVRVSRLRPNTLIDCHDFLDECSLF